MSSKKLVLKKIGGAPPANMTDDALVEFCKNMSEKIKSKTVSPEEYATINKYRIHIIEVLSPDEVKRQRYATKYNVGNYEVYGWFHTCLLYRPPLDPIDSGQLTKAISAEEQFDEDTRAALAKSLQTLPNSSAGPPAVSLQPLSITGSTTPARSSNAVPTVSPYINNLKSLQQEWITMSRGQHKGYARQLGPIVIRFDAFINRTHIERDKLLLLKALLDFAKLFDKTEIPDEIKSLIDRTRTGIIPPPAPSSPAPQPQPEEFINPIQRPVDENIYGLNIKVNTNERSYNLIKDVFLENGHIYNQNDISEHILVLYESPIDKEYIKYDDLIIYRAVNSLSIELAACDSKERFIELLVALNELRKYQHIRLQHLEFAVLQCMYDTNDPTIKEMYNLVKNLVADVYESATKEFYLYTGDINWNNVTPRENDNTDNEEALETYIRDHTTDPHKEICEFLTNLLHYSTNRKYYYSILTPIFDYLLDLFESVTNPDNPVDKTFESFLSNLPTVNAGNEGTEVNTGNAGNKQSGFDTTKSDTIFSQKWHTALLNIMKLNREPKRHNRLFADIIDIITYIIDSINNDENFDVHYAQLLATVQSIENDSKQKQDEIITQLINIVGPLLNAQSYPELKESVDYDPANDINDQVESDLPYMKAYIEENLRTKDLNIYALIEQLYNAKNKAKLEEAGKAIRDYQPHP